MIAKADSPQGLSLPESAARQTGAASEYSGASSYNDYLKKRFLVIPSLNASGVLPPFVGADPTQVAECAPYPAEMTDVYEIFCTTTERRRIFAGFVGYRAALKSLGIVDGYQLVDGSFTEDCERLRGCSPNDIDIVTFGRLPVPLAVAMRFAMQHSVLFIPSESKATFSCDAYFVDLAKAPELLVADSAYWHGLFSHQRFSNLWKGALRVSLTSNDDLVREALERDGVVIPVIP